uniref:Fatty acid hydroxylase domain-containing protein n=1 Tax=Prasinoderma coloniale TaxID=156133 RepID=A0A7R9TQJ7_9VIRI
MAANATLLERSAAMFARSAAHGSAAVAGGGDFSSGAYSYARWGEWPSPVGLTLGILAVAFVQVFVVAYHAWRVSALKGGEYSESYAARNRIQKVGRAPYAFMPMLREHLGSVEGFVLLGAYLSGTWMFDLMPSSYYSFEGGVNLAHVAAQMLVQDAVQAAMHLLEHKLHPKLYRASHKPHHRFLNPCLFDAFNGSVGDTVCMILVPLYITANAVHCNVWSYMAFGAAYANWLCLIHAEYDHPWDPLCRLLGVGTPADHHVHHRLFVYNYGHIFMYWDRLLGTYRAPEDVRQFVNYSGVAKGAIANGAIAKGGGEAPTAAPLARRPAAAAAS